ncbi:bifunctional lysozyme/C40 family peptidase [Sporolactobacillus shoreicorticis]|uniref:Lysozyme family protein n=1 Tax=Sporolactobacillus shoreicorticis TaxID=1923877 RepID=A0ABW5S8X0_9BACL|nr:bifunctional lysozyme/C40 family peptidase [Sporolactobacillus shoreicorticis]MCO7128209.1 bifunctional lysozyme/C40 family peptidase [Sporolactobacillus shoreicorticis]
MKRKLWLILGAVFAVLFSLLIFVAVFISNEEDGNSSNGIDLAGANLSQDVLVHQPMVEKYAKNYKIKRYVGELLAIMQVESGGRGRDVMQSMASTGQPEQSFTVEDSIRQGCKYLAALLQTSKKERCDLNTVIQSYNYGGSFIDYVASHGKKYTLELAENFAKEKAAGEKVSYTHPVAVEKNGGWRYRYGNMFYVALVSHYLAVAHFDDKTVQTIMNEALKYQGWRYVFGGDNPNTSFDCSGLTQWSFGKADIRLPRTAQAQYDATQHLPLSEAKPGDLVFFHGTYNAGTYITHVGIYVGNHRMYQAGDPIGYAHLTTSYWKKHFVSAGRIKNK